MNPDNTMKQQNQMSSINPQTNIYIAGHRGMVGSAIIRSFLEDGHDPQALITRTHAELDLTNQAEVRDFFKNEKIDHIVLAAAKVGGIHANNTYPADFIYSNLMIQCNIIHQAYKSGIEHLLFLGSSCIYPKFAPQPMKEEYLLTGELEPTNEPYAVAKIAGIKMCESYNRQYGTSYRSVMPTNLYGPGDNYHLENCHVIPAMIRKFHLAMLAQQDDLEAIQRNIQTYGEIPEDIKKAIGLNPQSSALTSSSQNARVILWGTGQSFREFLHVDDMASACLFTMELDPSNFTPDISNPKSDTKSSFLNVGTGKDQTIQKTATMIKQVIGFEGEVIFDSTKPDGPQKKLLDTQTINSLGWQPRYDILTGLQATCRSYLDETDKI